MVPKCFAALVAATTVLARTPSGFAPASETDLIVDYQGVAALNGALMSKSGTAAEPLIGTSTRLNGASYAVMMVDLDIPTANPPQTDTLLHWLQTDLTPASTATQLNPGLSVFLLENRAKKAALATYIGPNPPARLPLSHRYVHILVDTSALNAEGAQALQQAVTTTNRRGWDTGAVLRQAGLEGMVVAGNSFNVTNPGPVTGMAPRTGAETVAGAETESALETGTVTGAQNTTAPGTGTGAAPATGARNGTTPGTGTGAAPATGTGTARNGTAPATGTAPANGTRNGTGTTNGTRPSQSVVPGLAAGPRLSLGSVLTGLLLAGGMVVVGL